MNTAIAEPLPVSVIEQDTHQINFDLSPKQFEALTILSEADIEELLYGGAKGGGKSVFGCRWVFLKCENIIRKFALKSTENPIVVGFMGRKQAVSFRDTTLETWKQYIPSERYEINQQKQLITIDKTVAVRYGGLDSTDEGDVRKFNSAEYGFYFIDQAEEVSEQDIGMIRGTLRLKINGHELNYKGLLTANPRRCWIRDNFIDYPQAKTKFLQALPSDNPFLSSGYVDRLKKAFQFRPELLKAYLFGSWADLDIANVIIKDADVKRCIDNIQHDDRVIKRITVCDIAEDGEDETVIYDMENTKIIRDTIEIYRHKELMDTAGRIMGHASKNESTLVCGDVIGVGAGVMSRLREVYTNKGDPVVYGFDSRVKAYDPLTFFNHKIEAWWEASAKFQNGLCDIPNDPMLIAELTVVTYMFKSQGKLICSPKDEVKKIIKRSPNRADTYIMGLDALQHAPIKKKKDAYDDEPEDTVDPDMV